MSTVQDTHRQTLRTDIPSMAQFLQQSLGQRLVAYACGIKDPKAVGRYARSQGGTPRDQTTRRIRELYLVAQILVRSETPDTIRGWMIGWNPQLDEAPVELLHRDDPRPVIRAAEQFVAESS